MKYYIRLLIPVLFFYSCTKDKEVTLPGQSPLLVVNGQVSAGNKIKVYIGKTTGIKNYNKDEAVVTNAAVQLLANGSPAGNAFYNAATKEYESNTTAQAGVTYTVNVSAPGLPPVSAQCITPSKVDIAGVTFKRGVRKDSDGKLMDELTFYFIDPPAPDDLYVVNFQKKTVYDNGSVITELLKESGDNKSVFTLDRSVEAASPEGGDVLNIGEEGADNIGLYNDILVKDVFFNGESKSLTLYATANIDLGPRSYSGIDENNVPYTAWDTTYILLNHITRDQYLFLKSNAAAGYYGNDGFTEPINVHTNVTNGYGIFVIQHTSDAAIK